MCVAPMIDEIGPLENIQLRLKIVGGQNPRTIRIAADEAVAYGDAELVFESRRLEFPYRIIASGNFLEIFTHHRVHDERCIIFVSPKSLEMIMDVIKAHRVH